METWKMRKVWEFFRDNLFALGALIGVVITTVFTFGLGGSSKITNATLRNKKTSDQEKIKTFKEKIGRVKEFQELYENIVAEAEKKEEQVTEEQKEVLEERRKQYFEADTPEKRQKVLDDIQKNFGDLNYVPLSSIADVEDNDD
jgi:hypothetical protein